jgi:Nuclear pore protein 84 / 107
VVELGIYGEGTKQQFLEENMEVVRRNISFMNGLSAEDQSSIDVLKWLFRQRDYLNAFAFTNELARKFLLEGNVTHVKYLLD